MLNPNMIECTFSSTKLRIIGGIEFWGYQFPTRRLNEGILQIGVIFAKVSPILIMFVILKRVIIRRNTKEELVGI
jgi:hypothetical protein